MGSPHVNVAPLLNLPNAQTTEQMVSGDLQDRLSFVSEPTALVASVRFFILLSSYRRTKRPAPTTRTVVGELSLSPIEASLI